MIVTASDRFGRSSSFYSTNQSPPRVQFRWRAEIAYTGTQTGIETSGARYQAVSRDLAAQIAKNLAEQLDEMAAEHGAAGAVPERFYPDYIEERLLPQLLRQRLINSIRARQKSGRSSGRRLET